MSDKGQDVDLTKAKQNTGVWLVKVGGLSVSIGVEPLNKLWRIKLWR